MRFSIVVLAVILFSSACQENADKKAGITSGPANNGATETPQDSTQFTTIQWMETKKDFGKVTEGQKLEVAFRFKNTGDKPLIIYKVQPSCGCTVAETPEKPIQPGEEGVIKGAFDSNGRSGTQHKSLMVRANTKGNQDHELVFDVEVVKKT
jgi:uncharacterized protein DUF1573